MDSSIKTRGAISSTPPLNITSSASRSTSSSSLPSPPRLPLSNSGFHCQGLDLLAMAALDVELEKDPMGGIGGEGGKEEEKSDKKKEIGIEVGLKPKRGRRQMTMPSKFQDSVLQPWKRGTRGRSSLVAK